MSKQVIKSGVWYILGNFFTRGIGFLTTPIFTRMLSQEEFGEFNNLTTWVCIFGIITTLNLNASLLRAKYDHKEEFDIYCFSMIALSSISTVVFAIFMIAWSVNYKSLFNIDSKYFLAIIIYLWCLSAIDIFQTAQNIFFKYRCNILISIIVSVGSSLLSVLFVFIMGDKLLGRIMGYMIPTIVVGFCIIFYYARRSNGINTKYWPYALKISLPYLPHLLSMLVLGSMDRVMICDICGATDAAIYSLGSTVGSIVSVLVNSVNSAYSPWLADQIQRKEYNKIKKFSLYYAAIFAFLCCGVVLVTPEILYIMGGEQYSDAIHVIPPITAGCIMQFLYCMYVNIEQFEKKTVGMAFCSIIAALFNFVINLKQKSVNP